MVFHMMVLNIAGIIQMWPMFDGMKIMQIFGKIWGISYIIWVGGIMILVI